MVFPTDTLLPLKSSWRMTYLVSGAGGAAVTALMAKHTAGQFVQHDWRSGKLLRRKRQNCRDDPGISPHRE